MSDDTEDTSSDSDSDSGSGDSNEPQEGVKVPEAFQKSASALIEQCSSESCLNFVQDLCSEKRKQLMSSQKKSGNTTANFSSSEMPTDM